MHGQIQVGPIDYSIMVIYIAFVLGIGFVLKRYMKSSKDFLESGRSIRRGSRGSLSFPRTWALWKSWEWARRARNTGLPHVISTGRRDPRHGFLGVFMMPFYYGSKARSVPEYLKLRFNEKTRGFNAFSFAIMTIFASGISMYAMATLMQILLGWDFNFSIVMSAIIVLAYTFLGGLTSAIYNEVLQFFLIVAGFIPLVFWVSRTRAVGAASRTVCMRLPRRRALPRRMVEKLGAHG